MPFPTSFPSIPYKESRVLSADLGRAPGRAARFRVHPSILAEHSIRQQEVADTVAEKSALLVGKLQLRSIVLALPTGVDGEQGIFAPRPKGLYHQTPESFVPEPGGPPHVLGSLRLQLRPEFTRSSEPISSPWSL